MTNLTQSTKPLSGQNIKRKWHIIDVKGKILGRVTPQIGKLLQGKHKTDYVSYLDTGDYVVVLNAKEVTISGKKSISKTYTNYSGYPGGLKKITFEKLLEKNPTEIIRRAVSGMLPKNKLRDRRLTRLYIFSDGKHPYQDKFEIQKTTSEISSNNKNSKLKSN